MAKPIVHIRDWNIRWSDFRNGLELVGIATDHPELGTGRVWTSRILRVDPEKMEVETLNTLYMLEKD